MSRREKMVAAVEAMITQPLPAGVDRKEALDKLRDHPRVTRMALDRIQRNLHALRSALRL